MDVAVVLTAVVGLFIAGIIKGTTGLGYSTCALPFLVAALGLKPAMALVIIPAMTTNISLALSTGHFRETVSRFAWLYVAMLPGVAIGLYLLLWVSQPMVVRLLGLIIVAYALMALMKPNLAMPRSLERPLQIPAGFLNGLLTGLTGSQVMPLFPYIMALNLDQERMVQAINLAVLIASVILTAGLASTGVMSPALFAASLAAIVPALIGVELGARSRKLISVTRLRQMVLATLLLTGGMMLVR